MAEAIYELLSIDPIDSSATENGTMNRLFASIAGLAFMTTAGVASADCISDCEANCLFGDPGQIGLCIASCPAQCAVPLEPPCITNGGVNACSTTAVRLTPSNTGSGGMWTLSNDGAAAGSAKAFMTLSCTNVGVIKTKFKGSKTVNVGTTQQVLCGALGFTFNATCGRALTCSGGVP